MIVSGNKMIIFGNYFLYLCSMIIHNKQLIEAFLHKHPTSASPLKKWVEVVESMNWKHQAELKNSFLSADYVGNGRYVFNIKGNDFRLVAVVVFVAGTVFVRWVGSHRDYNKINVKNI